MPRYMVKHLNGGGWKEVEADTEDEAIRQTGWDMRVAFVIPLGRGIIRKSPEWMRDKKKARCPMCSALWTKHSEDGACPDVSDDEAKTNWGEIFGWR